MLSLNRMFVSVFVSAMILLAATSPASHAQSSKPHPLWGNTTVGSSSELASLWTSATDGEVGMRLGDYDSSIPSISMMTEHTLETLPVRTHYFAVSAYDASGNESGYSNEVSKVIQ